MGANRYISKQPARVAPVTGMVLMMSALAGCMATGDPGLGLIPQETIGDVEAVPVTETAGDPAASGHMVVEMAFDDAAPQTVPYANTTVNTTADAEPEYMLAIAPTPQASEAPGASASALPEPAPQTMAVPHTAEPLGRQSRLAGLFSFGKPRPPAEIIHLAGGSGNAAPANGAATRTPRPVIDMRQAELEAMPVKRRWSLFGIGGRTPPDDGNVRLASAAGLARLAPNGLRAQHDNVQMACLKPKLIRLLKKVRRHYGRDIIVTSGYRSAKANRRAGGARGSRHTTCEAADIQVPGVSKWELARYLRTVRGRGGVGTYCHTNSVHIDIGRKRDWNWRCRRR